MSRAVRYRVLRKIARGGMAEIFLAVQIGAEGFEKPVVLKRILPALAADPAFVRMLVDEAHIASTLSHSNLVQVLDLGRSGDQFFLVLELVDGWSLEQVRRRAQKARMKLPVPLVLYVVSALCRALDYVHRRAREGKPLGIVHRDVTPQNVLVSREGEVKLADFGIAKAAGRREKSATGVIKGKFAYMSPEQSIGAELDARSDLFSVGTLLYVLTTGRKPFEAATDLEVLMQVRKARYEKPSALVRDFNPDVERFIARALRADRARRWQSAGQMADRLDAILVKLGQASGPAALKRWLETLSARDGVRAPGDLGAWDTDVPSGTIELESGDLEPHEIDALASDEISTHREPLRPRVRGRRPDSDVATNDGAQQPIGPPPSATPAAAPPGSPIEARSADDDGSDYEDVEIVAASTNDIEAPSAPAMNDLDSTSARALASPTPEPSSATSWSTPSPSPSRSAAASSHSSTVESSSPSSPPSIALPSPSSSMASTESALPAPSSEETALDDPDGGFVPERPARGRPRRFVARAARATARTAVAMIVTVAMLGGGAYVIHPYLPAWLIRPVDSWLERLPVVIQIRGRLGSRPNLH